jgi:transcriptional regulator with XRE-family HTH domain
MCMAGRSIRFTLDGERLAEQREQAGLSQEALADKLADAGARRVSRGAVANWETERTRPVAESFRALVEVLAQIHEVDSEEMRRRLQSRGLAA